MKADYTSPVIYKRANTGAVKQWQVQAVNGVMITTRGQKGGKLSVDRVKCEPTNVGRSNERTAREQAVFESKAALRLRLRKEWVEDERKIDQAFRHQPMLAKKGEDKFQAILDREHSIYVQPKLDGVRCLALLERKHVTLYSRSGLKFSGLEHVKEALMPHTPNSGHYWLDGELYVHGEQFQQINQRIVSPDRKARLGLGYHVYDMPSDSPFRLRYTFLEKLFSKLTSDVYRVVETVEVHSMLGVTDYFQEAIQRGYEGIMGRDPVAPYDWRRRSDALIKMKAQEDEDFEIVGFEAGTRGKDDGCLMWICRTEDGERFRVVPKMSLKARRDLYKKLTEKPSTQSVYVGQRLKVRYFAKTVDGKPRGGVGLGVRLAMD